MDISQQAAVNPRNKEVSVAPLRQRLSIAEKRRIVEETLAAGASVARVWKTLFNFHICIACCELLRRQIAQRAVRAHLVVIDPPIFNGLSCVVEGQEPALVQAFLAELSMEALDVAVLHRPAWRDEVQSDFVFIGHWSSAFEVNSVPWSMTIRTGRARCCRSFSSTRTTRSDGNEVSTSIASIARV